MEPKERIIQAIKDEKELGNELKKLLIHLIGICPGRGIQCDIWENLKNSPVSQNYEFECSKKVISQLRDLRLIKNKNMFYYLSREVDDTWGFNIHYEFKTLLDGDRAAIYIKPVGLEWHTFSKNMAKDIENIQL